MNKIVYISIAPLTESLLKRLYVDILDDSKISVEFWDLRAMYYESNIPLKNISYIKYIQSKKELKNNIQNLDSDNTLINIQIGYEFKYLTLFRLFNKFKTSFFYIGTFPFSKSENKSVSRLKKLFSKRVFEKSIEILFKKFSLVKEYDFIFASDSKADRIFINSKVFPINYVDYEKTILKKDDLKDNHILFIDQNLANHADFAQMGYDLINQKNYENSLCKIFKYLEKKFSLKVIIALHPTRLEKYTFWPENQQHQNNTDILIKDSKFIVSHYSTAITGAFSFYKPLILLYSEEILTKIDFVKPVINGFKEEYNITTVNLDSEDYSIKLPKVDINKYNEFLFEFCTNEKTKLNFAKDYLVDYIKQI